MYKYLGLFLFAFGALGGWWLAKPPRPETAAQVSASEAWHHFRAEAARANTCEGDIAPHPAWVALALALSSLLLLTVTSHHPWHAWKIALGLRSSTSGVAVPF